MISSPWLQSFLTHLTELRSRLLKVLGVFIAALVLCFNYADPILGWVIAPAGTLVFTTPGGGFQALMTIAVVMACIVSSPFIAYQAWAFIAKALKPQERRYAYIFAPMSLFFFLTGACFAYWVAVPMAYKFLMGFTGTHLTPMISVEHYLGFVGNMVLAFGVAFELPLMLAFLAKIGIASPEFLRQKRRYAVIIILIVAAVVTPPDVVSLLILAVPLLLLYELGIVMVGFVYKHKTL